MAKRRKKKAAEKAEPAKPAKKEDRTRYISGIIIAIIVIIVLILLIRSCTKEAPVPVAPTAPEAAPEAAPGPSQVTAAPEEVKMCPSERAIGYVPGTCAIDADSVSMTLKGQGKAGIEGIWFYMTGIDGKTSYWKDTTTGVQNEEVVFNVPAKNVKQLLALPMIDGKACFNQRIIVVKDTNCVK